MNKKVILGTGTKKILVLTGIHGNELTPVYCGKLLNEHNWINDSKNFKKLTILNAINKNGIQNNTREINYDSTSDINRMFSSEKYDFSKNELLEYFENNDVILDIHSSPAITETFLLNQDGSGNNYVRFLNKLNLNYYIRYSNANTTKNYCLNKNKIGFTLELNKMDYIDFESAKRGLNIVVDVIKNINSFDNSKKEEPKFKVGFDYYTYYEGLFIPNKKLGDVVENEKDIIGKVINLDDFSEKIIYYGNNSKGKIIAGNISGYVSPSNPIYLIQPI